MDGLLSFKGEAKPADGLQRGGPRAGRMCLIPAEEEPGKARRGSLFFLSLK